MGLATQLKHAWNAFVDGENVVDRTRSYGGAATYGNRSDTSRRFGYANERSIIAAIYNTLATDSAAIDIRHVRVDDNERYLSDVDSGLNNCLTVEANLDQAATHFRQDIVSTMLNDGVVAIVPVDTTINPNVSGSYDIRTMRCGTVVAWYPRQVRVSLYNIDRGIREEITLDKKFVAIVENPFYSVMNEQSSTLKRLVRKLNLLDAVDEQSSSGKLDLIVQLPYVIKSEARRQQAEQRRTDIEFQLKGSQYGIAYTDGSEKITQLNRPAENNLLAQVTYLTNELYGQLGLTPEIMNGTADEKTMLNYMNRTIGPIVQAISEAMKRTFLTQTARTQGQSIMYFRDPFKLVPIGQIADIADKFTRNEIASANDIRQVIGWKPSKDPKADQLINSNMPQPNPTAAPASPDDSASDSDTATIMNDAFDQVNASLDGVLSDLGVPSDENS